MNKHLSMYILSTYVNACKLPKMFCIVDLKSLGSIPKTTDRLDTSEQLEMADNFLCMSEDNLRPEIFLSMILP